MVRVAFAYLFAPSVKFDFSYYVDRHLPLARSLLKPVRVEVDRGLSGEERGSVPRYVGVAYLYFEAVEDHYRALEEHGDALGNDVPNYTNAALEICVSEVVV
jgi:uncharacterized protein (TIGR02118 family)